MKTKILFCILLSINVLAQVEIKRVEPTNWWVGMKNPNVQLLVYGPNIAQATVSTNYLGVKIKKMHKVENPNYLFIDLEISRTAKAGIMPLVFSANGQKTTHSYKLSAKKHSPAAITSADLMYLIMPDRFSNGDASNDRYLSMADPEADRKSPWLRHGGDLLGIQNHLDYIAEIGITALWLNPVIENDQPQTNEGGSMRSAYHGYGFTDHYNVDRRLGGNVAYKNLINEAHKKGIKIVQDAVYNHVGINHWFVKDLPMQNWLNQWPAYTNTSHKDQPIVDPHAAAADTKIMTDGWFMPFLPDLNQRNPFLANYLIQHALWTVEEFGIDGWRIDTYKYNDLEFMNRCNKALTDEYPSLLLFGETTGNVPSTLSYFVQNNINFSFKCNLPSTCDFPLHNAFLDALKENYGWDSGVNRVYNVLSQDYVYQKPDKLVTFLDNHDSDRFLSVVGEDFDKYKIGLTWLLTTRGIPQLYYGTEILTKNFKDPTDAEVRKDFPGGFANDPVNKFVASGRTAKENEAFEFVKKLAHYRKNTPALHSGKLTQYLPENGIYVYFRHDASKKIMVVTNSNTKETEVKTARFTDMIGKNTKAKNVLSNATISDIATLKIPAKTAWVLELQ